MLLCHCAYVLVFSELFISLGRIFKMSFFSTGFNNVREEQKRAEAASKARKGQLFSFFLTSSAPEGVIVFLHNEPITFPAHVIQEGQRWSTKVCVASEGNCEYCARGDSPSTKGGYIIIDRTPFEYTDSSGKKRTNEGQLKLFLPGIRVLGQLDRKNSIKGLTGKEWYISRTGVSTATTYDFESGDTLNITAEYIGSLLNDELKKFTPKNDSPQEIERAMMELLKNQLDRLLPYGHNPEEEKEEEELEQKNSNSLLIRKRKVREEDE